MQRASKLESPFVKGAVTLCAAAGLWVAYLIYEHSLGVPPKGPKGPHRDFKLIRQALESEMPASDHPLPNMALSIWFQESSDFEGYVHDLGNGTFQHDSVEVVDSRGRKIPTLDFGSPVGEPIRFDIPWGYDHSPDKPALRFTDNGGGVWQTPLRSFPAPARLLQPVDKDDPRVTVRLDHTDPNQPVLNIQVNRTINRDEVYFLDRLRTTYCDVWRQESLAGNAGGGMSLPTGPMVWKPWQEAIYGEEGVGHRAGLPTGTASTGYVDSVREAQVRVRIARIVRRPAGELQVHGVSLEFAYGQPAAIVKKRIAVPYGDGEELVFERQGYRVPRPQKVIDPTIELFATDVPQRAQSDPMAQLSRMYVAEWLGPTPDELGLKAIRFRGQRIIAKGPPSTPRAHALDPIRLRLIRQEAVLEEEYTVTVPVHR